MNKLQSFFAVRLSHPKLTNFNQWWIHLMINCIRNVCFLFRNISVWRIESAVLREISFLQVGKLKNEASSKRLPINYHQKWIVFEKCAKRRKDKSYRKWKTKANTQTSESILSILNRPEFLFCFGYFSADLFSFRQRSITIFRLDPFVVVRPSLKTFRCFGWSFVFVRSKHFLLSSNIEKKAQRNVVAVAIVGLTDQSFFSVSMATQTNTKNRFL